MLPTNSLAALTKKSNILGEHHERVFLILSTLDTRHHPRVTMSAKPTTKKFGKSTREVPASTEKAKKWYNAEDDSEPKTVSASTLSRLL